MKEYGPPIGPPGKQYRIVKEDGRFTSEWIGDTDMNDKELKQHAEDWDFDPKFRTGSISEETPDEKRRSMFYAINRHAIENMTSSVIHAHDNQMTSWCINYAALIISQIAKRAGEQHHLNLGDPEFGDATCIDEV